MKRYRPEATYRRMCQNAALARAARKKPDPTFLIRISKRYRIYLLSQRRPGERLGKTVERFIEAYQPPTLRFPHAQMPRLKPVPPYSEPESPGAEHPPDDARNA